MKHILKICMIAAMPLLAVSCFDNVPTVEDLPRDPVSFEYVINGDYNLDFYVGSTITFTNTSSQTGEAVWDFGDGSQMKGDKVEKYYEVAGTYQVKLTVGEFSKTQVIMISDIKPLLSLRPIEGDLCEVNTSKVSFQLEVPNPRNLKIEYNWILPEGTKTAAGEEITTCTDSLPGELIFSNVGSQTVRLQVKLGGRLLEEGRLNVQVGYNQEVPTLYYAVQGGNLMAYKLISDAPEGMKISSFDLGISSGQHPFNLLFKEHLFVLDCGKQYYYVDDADGVLGDGKISVVAKDGSKVETMITNAGQAAFDDPFYGYIEGDNLYFANRNTGIVRLPLSTRNAVYSKTDNPYFVQNATLGYYNNGWSYGAIGGCFGKVDGVWYWSKFYNGNGFYRFEDSDILATATAGGEPAPAAGIALAGMWPKSFAYDATDGSFYFSIMDAGGYAGVYKCTLAELEAIGSSKKALAPYMLKYEGLGFECDLSGNYRTTEGYASEPVGICQMVLDESSRCVYFAFRNPAKDPTLAPSGIYRYNPATAKVELVIEGVNVYGITINKEPSKLF